MFIDGGPWDTWQYHLPVEIPPDVCRFPSLTIITPPQDQLAGSSKVKGPQIEHATPQALLPEQDEVPFRFFNIIISVICQHYQTQEKIFIIHMRFSKLVHLLKQPLKNASQPSWRKNWKKKSHMISKHVTYRAHTEAVMTAQASHTIAPVTGLRQINKPMCRWVTQFDK